jgi:hypothetical protein
MPGRLIYGKTWTGHNLNLLNYAQRAIGGKQEGKWAILAIPTIKIKLNYHY